MSEIKFNGRLIWAMVALVLMSMGLGAMLFKGVTGLLLMIVGFVAGYMWFRKYGTKRVPKPVVPAAPVSATSTAEPELSDAEAARRYRQEQALKGQSKK